MATCLDDQLLKGGGLPKLGRRCPTGSQNPAGTHPVRGIGRRARRLINGMSRGLHPSDFGQMNVDGLGSLPKRDVDRGVDRQQVHPGSVGECPLRGGAVGQKPGVVAELDDGMLPGDGRR